MERSTKMSILRSVGTILQGVELTCDEANELIELVQTHVRLPEIKQEVIQGSTCIITIPETKRNYSVNVMDFALEGRKIILSLEMGRYYSALTEAVMRGERIHINVTGPDYKAVGMVLVSKFTPKSLPFSTRIDFVDTEMIPTGDFIFDYGYIITYPCLEKP